MARFGPPKASGSTRRRPATARAGATPSATNSLTPWAFSATVRKGRYSTMTWALALSRTSTSARLTWCGPRGASARLSFDYPRDTGQRAARDRSVELDKELQRVVDRGVEGKSPRVRAEQHAFRGR